MKKGLVLVVMCVAMLFAAAPSASAQAPSDEYKATLEKMLELSGSMASAKAMVPQMISMLKQQSSASVSFWDGFQKKWEESCDELEKFTIYRSAYKAYNTGTKVCVIMFTSLLLLSFFFDYGPLPAAAVGVVWLVNTVTYCREAIRLEKEKINL